MIGLGLIGLSDELTLESKFDDYLGQTVCQGIYPYGSGLHGLLVPIEHPYKFSTMWFSHIMILYV